MSEGLAGRPLPIPSEVFGGCSRGERVHRAPGRALSSGPRKGKPDATSKDAGVRQPDERVEGSESLHPRCCEGVGDRRSG